MSNITRVSDADSRVVSERDALRNMSARYTRMADGTLTRIETTSDDGKNPGSASTYAYG
ncbi:hypothetical protein [Caballeronia sp. Lep1P3]|uniref:hypothetical protein n=1 Tax=Caballeronia sp. Lep1P3 TaxID=2878150 RepID=UPI001FD37C44|nr:hypothetical protein [Caballeronia sp. Lep1P3]